MIDLNKYYISSTYQGASATAPGRSGFVPKALSGDNLKFLRGDGTWQTVQSVNINLIAGTTYTIQLSDNGGTVASTSTTGLTAVPSSSITYPAGFRTAIIQLSTARVSLSSATIGLTINQANGYFRTTNRYSAATLLYTGSLAGWVLYGDVSS